MHSHYDILKVPPSCSDDEINTAYKRFRASIMAFAPGVDLTETDMQRLFPLVWEARQVLTDPISRREYDLSLALVASGSQPEQIELFEEPKAPQSMLRTVIGYSGFVLMMAVFVFFLYYLAGYIL